MEFICKVKGCELNFGLIGEMAAHLSSMHMNSKNQRNFDGWKLRAQSLQALRQHWQTNTGENHFKCDFDGCSRTFRLKRDLSDRYRIHTGEKPYSCAHRGKAYRVRRVCFRH